jgi:hypothetical protein
MVVNPSFFMFVYFFLLLGGSVRVRVGRGSEPVSAGSGFPHLPYRNLKRRGQAVNSAGRI